MIDREENQALALVEKYIRENIDFGGEKRDYQLFVIWKCVILDNCKFLIKSTYPDVLYFEMTYSEENREWYMDVYWKIANRVIKE